MFQLSCSLSLILNMIDLKEANRRKCTYNSFVVTVGVVFIVCSSIEIRLDEQMHREHLMFEALALIVLCVIYFSTQMDLLRKLRLFVLEETKKEARLVNVQFIIFFIAYGTKVVTLLYWVKNPPHERKNVSNFLLNDDAMSVIWVLIPVAFLLWMQARTFRKIRDEGDLGSQVAESVKEVKINRSSETDDASRNKNLTIERKTESDIDASSFLTPSKDRSGLSGGFSGGNFRELSDRPW